MKKKLLSLVCITGLMHIMHGMDDGGVSLPEITFDASRFDPKMILKLPMFYQVTILPGDDNRNEQDASNDLNRMHAIAKQDNELSISEAAIRQIDFCTITPFIREMDRFITLIKKFPYLVKVNLSGHKWTTQDLKKLTPFLSDTSKPHITVLILNGNAEKDLPIEWNEISPLIITCNRNTPQIPSNTLGDADENSTSGITFEKLAQYVNDN